MVHAPGTAAPSGATSHRPAPHWTGLLFAGLALGLLPWIVWLGYTLPAKHVARHWDVAWTGFDVALAAALATTAIGAARDARWLTAAASSTATLLACDAWFDVLTAAPGAERDLAVVQALACELPLALLCLWAARNGGRVRARAEHYRSVVGGERRRAAKSACH